MPLSLHLSSVTLHCLRLTTYSLAEICRKRDIDCSVVANVRIHSTFDNLHQYLSELTVLGRHLGRIPLFPPDSCDLPSIHISFTFCFLSQALFTLYFSSFSLPLLSRDRASARQQSISKTTALTECSVISVNLTRYFRRHERSCHRYFSQLIAGGPRRRGPKGPIKAL